GVGDGREIDREVGTRSEAQRFPQNAREPARPDDANLIRPGLTEHRRRVLLADNERDVGPGKPFANRANRGNVEKQIAELIVGTVGVRATRLGVEDRLERRGHSPEPESDLPDLARSFSSSRTLTSRSWQDAGISVFS